MRKSTGLALAAILLAAIGIRLSPLLGFLYWGSDIGEYFAILQELLRTGRVSTAYDGWGITYPYFPGMFFVPGAASAMAPLDASAALNLLVPAFGGLAALPVFLLAVGITGERKAGLFAAAFIALVMPHVYPTSHAAPATLGDLLVVAALVLFVRLRRDPKALAPLLLVGAALVVTHHLSTYFLLIMLLFAVFVRGLLRPAPSDVGSKREVAYLGALLGITSLFWFGYATTFRDGLIRDVNVQPWWLLLAVFPAGLAGMAALVVYRRQRPWRFRPRYPDLRRSAGLYAATVGFVLFLMAFATLVAIPGTSIAPPASVLYYFAPVYILVSFSAAGRKFFDFQREGIAPTAWFLALLASIVLGTVAAPRLLIPYRHVEIVIIPLAIFAGVGLFRLLDLADVRGRSRTLAVGLTVVLLAASAATALPPPETLGRWQEGVRPPALDAAYWSRDHVGGLLATDHRASSLAFGFGGVDATWDTTRTPLLAHTFDEARPGMLAVASPSGIRDVSYVWVDRDIEEGVQLFPWEPATPMDPAAILKFSDPPFLKVFDNGFARVYWVDWGLAP